MWIRSNDPVFDCLMVSFTVVAVHPARDHAQEKGPLKDSLHSGYHIPQASVNQCAGRRMEHHPTCFLQGNLAVTGHAHSVNSTDLHLAFIHVAMRVLETVRAFSPKRFTSSTRVDPGVAASSCCRVKFGSIHLQPSKHGPVPKAVAFRAVNTDPRI